MSVTRKKIMRSSSTPPSAKTDAVAITPRPT